MAGWSVPGLGEAVRARLEEAGFTPESMARARPSELVKRAGLRADVARRVVAHYRGEVVENGEGPVETAPPRPAVPNGEGREAPLGGEGWERVWDFASRPERSGAPWRWRGRVVLKVSLGRRT